MLEDHQNYQQPPKAETFTLDDETVASNPGNLEVDYFHYFSYFPEQITRLITCKINFIFMMIATNAGFIYACLDIIGKGRSINNLPFVILSIIVFNAFFIYSLYPLYQELVFLFNHTKERFIYGCVNPGIVISTTPLLIAVFTDLTTGGFSHPAIKILPHPLKLLTYNKLKTGTRIATVALYEGTLEKPHWDDFYPIAADCATKNHQNIKQVLMSIPEWEWQALETGLKQIKNRQKPGLYFLQKDNFGEWN